MSHPCRSYCTAPFQPFMKLKQFTSMPSNAATTKESDASTLLHQFPLKLLRRALHPVFLCFYLILIYKSELPIPLIPKSNLFPDYLFLLNCLLLNRLLLHHPFYRWPVAPALRSPFSRPHSAPPSPPPILPLHQSFPDLRTPFLRPHSAQLCGRYHGPPQPVYYCLSPNYRTVCEAEQGGAGLSRSRALGTAREVRLNRLGMRGCWAPRNGATRPNGW